MKRNIVVVFLILSLISAGVVSAANLWGTYKGNDIINLTVDGKQAQVLDVPVISYSGRAMLPIYLLKQAGLKFTWDVDTQTINIFTAAAADRSKDEVIDKIKRYSTISSLYEQLEDLAPLFKDISTRLFEQQKQLTTRNNYANISRELENIKSSILSLDATLLQREEVFNSTFADIAGDNETNGGKDIIELYKLCQQDHKDAVNYLSEYVNNPKNSTAEGEYAKKFGDAKVKLRDAERMAEQYSRTYLQKIQNAK